MTEDAAEIEVSDRDNLRSFAPQEPIRPPRSTYNHWAATRPLLGHWHALDRSGIERDPIDEAELVKDRASDEKI